MSATQKANFFQLDQPGRARAHQRRQRLVPMQLWRAIRLGGASLDGVHVNMMGNQLLAGYALKGARSWRRCWPCGPQLNANAAGLDRPDYVFIEHADAKRQLVADQSAPPHHGARCWWPKQFGGTPLLRPDTWWAASGGAT